MKKESLDKVMKIKEELTRLEAEINEIENFTKRGWRISLRKLLSKPTKTTYKGFYCASGIDSIGSCIILETEEINAIKQIKLNKIKILQEELSNL